MYCGTGEWVSITLCNLTNKPPLDRWDEQRTQHNRKPWAYSMMLTTFMNNSNSPWLDCANVKNNFLLNLQTLQEGNFLENINSWNAILLFWNIMCCNLSNGRCNYVWQMVNYTRNWAFDLRIWLSCHHVEISKLYGIPE